MKFINLNEGSLPGMSYPVMARLVDAVPRLKKMYEVIQQDFPGAQLIGTGTSGAAIGTWLQVASGYTLKYTHIREKLSPSHRSSYHGSKDGNLVIVDDLIASGTTICYLLESLPEKSTVHAIITTWDFFAVQSRVVARVKRVAKKRDITIKNMIAI